MKYSYYKNELKRLVTDNEYNQSVIISDSQGNKTKTLSLNVESIPVIMEYLSKELQRLQDLQDDETFKDELMDIVNEK